MSEIKVKREQEQGHVCVCTLLIPGEEETSRDKCQQWVGPDEAFCEVCEANEHHLLPNQVSPTEWLAEKRKKDSQ